MEHHRGHRARTKRKFLQSEGEGFNAHELLELLLFYSIPRRNTNEIAHELVERFGSINNIARASIDELKLVPGIGNNSAILLKIVLPLAKKYAEEENKKKKRLNTIDAVVDFTRQHTMGAVKELVYAVFTDNSLNVLGVNLISSGAINEVKPLFRTIMELAVLKRASAVIIVHNHPNGCVEASQADLDFTAVLERELEIIGIHLVEHVIVSDTEYMAVLKNMREIDGINSQIDLEKFYGE